MQDIIFILTLVSNNLPQFLNQCCCPSPSRSSGSKLLVVLPLDFPPHHQNESFKTVIPPDTFLLSNSLQKAWAMRSDESVLFTLFPGQKFLFDYHIDVWLWLCWKHPLVQVLNHISEMLYHCFFLHSMTWAIVSFSPQCGHSSLLLLPQVFITFFTPWT